MGYLLFMEIRDKDSESIQYKLSGMNNHRLYLIKGNGKYNGPPERMGFVDFDYDRGFVYLKEKPGPRDKYEYRFDMGKSNDVYDRDDKVVGEIDTDPPWCKREWPNPT